MKKTLLLLVCLAFALPAMSQGGTKIVIKGLHNPKKMAVMAVISSDMQNNTCQVTKTLDRHSEKLEQAAQTGKVFTVAFAKYDGVDGEIVKKMSTVYISDYSISSSGNNATETFTLRFNSLEDGN